MRSGLGGTTASPRAPARIADYRIERRVGRGGMGVVYLAFDERLGRKVAVKVMSHEVATDASFRHRFIRESRLAASIGHPNVIPIFQAGEADGQLFLVMPYIEGSDLGSVVRQNGALDPAHALAVAKQVAAALDAAHRAGLVHRDVKPANVLLQPGERGEPEHCYLTDFGLTKRSSATSGVTRTGELLGTPSYMAPEQIRGDEVGAAADTYALGCLVFEALTGRAPYPRPTEAAVLAAHVYDPPPSARALQPELPPAIDEVLTRALAKDPRSRHSSCGSLAAAAAAALTGTADGEARAAVPPASFSSAARTRPEQEPARLANRQPLTSPPRPPPPRESAPTTAVTKQGRGPLLPAAIVAGAILLCAGAIVAALLVKRSDGMSAAEIRDAQRLIDRTDRLNRRLSNLAERVQADSDTATDRERLAVYRARAEELRRQVRAQIEQNRVIRDALSNANAQLASASSALSKASAGNRDVTIAITLLQQAAKNTQKASQELKDQLSNKSGGGLPKSKGDAGARGGPKRLRLPADALFTIDAPRGGSFISLAGAGDINADGKGDVLAGAQFEDGLDTYALFGGSDLGRLNLQRLGAKGFVIDAGERVSGAGDLNGDRRDDVVVPIHVAGSRPVSVAAVSGAGARGLVDPSAGSSVLATFQLPTADTTPRCESTPAISATGAGDVNGDGRNDVLIAAPCYGLGGEAWVVFGPWQSGEQVDLGSLGSGGFEISGAQAGESGGLGSAIAAGQDLNGDGKDDLVLGEPDRSGGGAAYVVYGTDATDAIDVDALGSAGYALTHSGSSGAVGESVAMVGDMNGDGRDDLLVGEPGASPRGRSGSGDAFVVFGGRSGGDVDLGALGGRGFAIVGPTAARGQPGRAGLGASAAAAGDTNGDGHPDAIIGSPGLAGSAGVAYVVYGGGASTTLDLARPGGRATVLSVDAGAQAVWVGGGSDIGGDGGSDVLLAPAGLTGEASEAYVVSLGK